MKKKIVFSKEISYGVVFATHILFRTNENLNVFVIIDIGQMNICIRVNTSQTNIQINMHQTKSTNILENEIYRLNIIKYIKIS